jgi:riboflavin kinase
VAERTKITRAKKQSPSQSAGANGFRSPVLLKTIKLNGTIFSGQGEGKKFLELPWVKRQLEEKLGFTPYSGTLNILLSRESVKRRKLLEKAHSLKVCPAEGYCNGLIFTASIGDLRCAIVIPEVANYPSNVLEIVAPENLREKLHLKDGDETSVCVNL